MPNSDTLFINVTCWEKLGETVAERLRKGDKVVVHGSLRQESWTDAEGVKATRMTIRAVNVEFMSSRESTDDTDKEAAPRALNENESEPTGLPF